MNETVSVVICTYRRARELRSCLSLIIKQLRLPNEIVVVDNDPSRSAEATVNELDVEFAKLNIPVNYHHNVINSLTAARNLGIEKSSGSIVTFIDDDVELDSHYLGEILSVFASDPAVMGVQGHMQGLAPNRFGNLISSLFCEFHYSDKAQVFASVAATYPSKLNRIDSCEWLSGSNHSYRRAVFKRVMFDEKLTKYSEGEDLDFSYRVFTQFPGTLRITPFARLVHSPAESGRLGKKELVVMREVYGLYLYHKLFSRFPFGRIQFVWSRIGRILISFLRLLLTRNAEYLHEMATTAGAYYYCWQHRAAIAAGDLNFFNCRAEIK